MSTPVDRFRMRPRRRNLLACLAGAAVLPLAADRGWAQALVSSSLVSWPLGTTRPTGIHDAAPSPDGGVWYTAQRSGHLGWFDPRNGKSELLALGAGSAPHGVVTGPDGAAWITDSGQNALVRVAWPGRVVTVFALPAGTPYANLNTCAFDGAGDLWFTGQSGYVGKLSQGERCLEIPRASISARRLRGSIACIAPSAPRRCGGR